MTSPATWDHPDLRVYYKLTRSSSATRTATRALPASTSTPNEGKSGKKNIGAITGGVVGGLAVLVVILGLILLCLHRQKKANKENVNETAAVPAAELDVNNVPQEMSTTNANKSVPVHEWGNQYHQQSYAELAPHHPQTLNYDQTTLRTGGVQSYHSTSPQASRQQSSFQDGVYNQPSLSPIHSTHSSEPYPANNHVPRNVQPESVILLSNGTPIRQRQHSYPSLTSPRHQTDISAQTYYPPPQDSLRYRQPSQDLHQSDQRGSPTGTHYSGETQHSTVPSMSTSTVPAHFYSQATPTSGPDLWA